MLDKYRAEIQAAEDAYPRQDPDRELYKVIVRVVAEAADVAEKQGKTIERLTWVLAACTVVIAVLTAVLVFKPA